MQILDSIRIGGVDYSLNRHPVLNNGEVMLYGQVDYLQCRIDINTGYNRQLQYITLLHEILHVLLHNADINLGEEEEEIIDTCARGMYQVLVDNQTLICAKEG